ncbi:MAG: F0F1 ATP synthase subunit alpha [Candidatus Saganbacteria bacterium]|nr:F0F1 ATP synthase subunit alpha [Candidatus Saganbacteria bacterium]
MLKPDEITAIIRGRIKGFSKDLDVFESGVVTAAGDGVATVYGLSNVMYNELIEFSSGVTGIAFSLLSDCVGCIILGDAEKIKEGDTVRRTKKVMSIPVGDALIGRVIDPLGKPLDEKGPVRTAEYRPIESPAPSVVDREPVQEPLQTGIKAIDSMIPIGRGQRELIIGDRSIGKTAIAIDTILNQKDKSVICIYVAIGQKASNVARIVDILNEHGAMQYTTVMFAGASDSPALQYIAPYAGCAIGEHYLYSGRHALLIYDDLSKHAVAYRQISLLLRRPPGREAYPGDIFYLHSRLLERASKLNKELGSGSLTALPIIETQEGDISAYIPTNVISITDGQIYLETDLFNSDVKPAINVGLSVSRVGGSAQISAMKKVAGRLRLDLAQYRELAAFSQFSADIDKSTGQQLLRGEKLTELLKQPQYRPMDAVDQVISIFAGTKGYLDDIENSEIAAFESELLSFMKSNHPEVMNEIRNTLKISDQAEKQLISAVETFKNAFKAGVKR